MQRAELREAGKILALQRLAYRSEAALYGDGIPPMVETLEELRAAFRDHVFLKAVFGGETVGSVRLREADGICFIGRLVVLPERQGRGVGTRLMYEAERLFAPCRSFRLFTGSRSEGNLRLYRRLGYGIVGEKEVGPSLTLVHLEKTVRPRSDYD